MILGAETFRQEDSASRRRKAEQTKRSRQRQKEKRLLELERKRERNKTTSGQYGGGKGNSLHWNDFPNLECAAYIPSWRNCFSEGGYNRERVRAFFVFLFSLFTLFIYLLFFHTQLCFDWGVRGSARIRRCGGRSPHVFSEVKGALKRKTKKSEGGEFGSKVPGLLLLWRCRGNWAKEQDKKIGWSFTNTRLKRREESVEVTSLPKYQVGNTALLEANTKGRGCNLFYISSFCIHSQMYATLLVRFS